MAIDRDDYEYNVVEGDSLRKIAQKHGLDPLAGARRIWEYTWEKRGYSDDANMHGKTVHRKLHMGNNRYVNYDHSRWGDPGYKGYNDPHQIILYSGETVWIPPREYEISDEELINGFVPDTCKRYKLKFPVFAVRLDLEILTKMMYSF
jgi:hypothetical protein